jgi:transitional endoplasmic reticulum ATPase
MADRSDGTEREEGVIRLQVAGAKERDVGKGTARLSRSFLQKLGLREGDAIELTGKRKSAAIALPPYPEDEGLQIIRLDGLERANVGVSIGDHVEVRRADVKPAARIVLAPAQRNVRLMGSGEALLRTLMGRPLAAGDVISTSVYQRTAGTDESLFPRDFFQSFFQPQRAFGLQEIRLVVTSTAPRGIVRVGEDTQIELKPLYSEPEEPRSTDVTYDDIGGVGPIIQQVREMIELPLRHPELFSRLGIEPPKGVLLYGPPGTGKTLLARAIANESEAHFFHIGGPEIMGRYYGESEQRLREMFQQAQANAPAIIFIDEIDSIAPKRSEVSGEVERRVVAQLLSLMDGLQPRQSVIVIGATNRIDAIDEALRRPGRFDREIVVGVPDQTGRREILAIHTRGMPMAEDVNLDEIAQVTYGFVGADLSALAREAAIETLRRNLPSINLDEKEIPPEVLQNLVVTRDDMLGAMKRVQPSALREIMIQVPDVRWEDVGGLEEAKRTLRESIELPLKNPQAFRRLGIRPAKGFLLYGPPGTGKTLLAKAVAREAQANFIATKSSDVLSKWYGESEKQIARLFARARQVAPTVVFIDEIDSLAPQRGASFGEPAVTERVVNSILAEMDGLEELQGVVVIGATNQPRLVDTALLRPGRFDDLVYVSVPDRDGRKRILEIHTKGMPLASDVNLESLADRTEGFTGADLEDLARRAGLMALRENMDSREIPMRLFEASLQESRASVTPEMEEEYRRMAETLKHESVRPTRRIGFTGEEERAPARRERAARARSARS